MRSLAFVIRLLWVFRRATPFSLQIPQQTLKGGLIVVLRLAPASGDLLTACRHIGVEAEGTGTPNVALVALGVVAEFHRAAPLAVEPDRKALVIQAQNLSGGRTQKAQQDEDCHQGFGW
jgi:hypothetical protein